MRPLTLAEKDDYVYKASIIGPLMGARYGCFPENWAQLQSYIDDVLHSGTLQVSDEARMLADYVLASLPIPVLGPVSSWLLKLPTAILLPPSLRDAYGLTSSNWKNHIFSAWAATSRSLSPALPRRVRLWKIALSAEQALEGNSRAPAG